MREDYKLIGHGLRHYQGGHTIFLTRHLHSLLSSLGNFFYPKLIYVYIGTYEYFIARGIFFF